MEKEHKIDKDIPFEGESRRKWPFKDMVVGDSAWFSEDEKPRAQIYAHVFGSQRGWKFATRSCVGGGLRVWRLK